MTGFTTKPEAHLMDINTVNLWLTNAKHQPTKTVEIEGTPATRQASLQEFFTSVATSAAFALGAKFGSDYILGLDSDKLSQIGKDFGFDSYIYKAADATLATKNFVVTTKNSVTSFIDDITKPVVDGFSKGYDAAKTLVNPLSNSYTDAIQKAGSAAIAYANQSSALAAVGIDNTAIMAAKQFTDGQGLPALQSAKDHTDNLTSRNFTVEDAVLAAAPSDPQPMISIWTATVDETQVPPIELPVNNNTLQMLGFEPSPTFEEMCGIFSKQELTDNLEAAIVAEESARTVLDQALALGVVQDINTAYIAWQQTFDIYRDSVLAIQTETRNNLKKIQTVITQESALRAINRTNTIRNTITDPNVKAVYDSCTTSQLKLASDALNFFENETPES